MFEGSWNVMRRRSLACLGPWRRSTSRYVTHSARTRLKSPAEAAFVADRNRLLDVLDIPWDPDILVPRHNGQTTTTLSPDALKLVKTHDIGFPSNVKPLKGQDQEKSSLKIFYSPRHCLFRQHTKFLTHPGHPLEAKFLSSYRALCERNDPLWWQCTEVNDTIAAPRIEAMKKARRAFLAALANNNYDKFGWSLSLLARDDGGSNRHSQGGRTFGGHLYGSVSIRVIDTLAFLKMDTSSVERYLTKIIPLIVMRFRE